MGDYEKYYGPIPVRISCTATLDSIQRFQVHGPWVTGTQLHILFNLPEDLELCLVRPGRPDFLVTRDFRLEVPENGHLHFLSQAPANGS